MASNPKALPTNDASPIGGALSRTIPTPPKATRAKASARRSLCSPKSLAPSGTIRNGESEPISAALTTLLCVTPAKNAARFSPRNAPGTAAWRTFAIVTRRPVLHRNTFHTAATVAILQNARRTPGDSARLTRVELSEKARTTPTTASAPSVFPSGARGRAVGGTVIVLELGGSSAAAGPWPAAEAGGLALIPIRHGAPGRRRPKRSRRRSSCPGSRPGGHARGHRPARSSPPGGRERWRRPGDPESSRPAHRHGRAAPAGLPPARPS